MTQDVRFMHVRPLNKDGEVSTHGGMTVAYVSDKDKVIGFAVARCHSKDNYVKSQGRAKAQGRLKSERYFVPVSLTRQDFYKNMQELFVELGRQ